MSPRRAGGCEDPRWAARVPVAWPEHTSCKWTLGLLPLCSWAFQSPFLGLLLRAGQGLCSVWPQMLCLAAVIKFR